MDELEFGFAVIFRDAVTKSANAAAAAVQNLWTQMQTAAAKAAASAASSRLFTAASSGLATAATAAGGALRAGGQGLLNWARNASAATGRTGILMRSLQGLAVFMGIRFLIKSFEGAAESGMDFETQMTRVGTVVDDINPAGLRRLTDQARLLGSTLAADKGAVSFAEGMGILGEAGLRTAEIYRAIKPTFLLSKLGELSMNEAGKTLVNVASQFNLLRNPTRVVNSLVQTANASLAAVDKMAISMRTIAPVAAAFGFNVEATSAMLGVFAQKGEFGNRSAVALRNIFASMVKPSKALTQALGVLHKSAEEVMPQAFAKRGVQGANDFFKMLKPLEHYPALMIKLFGLRTFTSVLGTLSSAPNAIAEMGAKIQLQATAAELYEQRLHTIRQQGILLKNALRDIGLTLYDIFGEQALGRLTSLKDFFLHLGEAIKYSTPALRALSNAFWGILDAVKAGLAGLFPVIRGTIHNLLEAGKAGGDAVMEFMGPLALSITMLGLDLEDFLTGFIAGFNKGRQAALLALTPVFWLLNKIGHALLWLGGKIDVQGNQWRGLGTIIGAVLGLVSTFKIVRWFLAIPYTALASWVNWGRLAVTSVTDVYRWVRDLTAVQAAWNAAVAFGTELIGALRIAWLLFNVAFAATPIGWIALAIVAVVGLFVLLWTRCEWFRTAVTSVFSTIWNFTAGFAMDAAAIIGWFLKAAWGAVKWVGAKVGEFFAWWGREFMVVWNWFLDTFNIREVLSGALDGAKKTFATIINWFHSLKLPKWLQAIVDFVTGGGETKLGIASDAYKMGARENLREAWDWGGKKTPSPTTVATAAPQVATTGVPFALALPEGAPAAGPTLPTLPPARHPNAFKMPTLEAPDFQMPGAGATPGAEGFSGAAPTLNFNAGAFKFDSVIKDEDAFVQRLIPKLETALRSRSQRGLSTGRGL